MSNFLRRTVPCFKCLEDVLQEDEIFMLGIEVPYMNLIFHRACYREIDDVDKFIVENLEKYININQKQKKMV